MAAGSMVQLGSDGGDDRLELGGEQDAVAARA